MLPATARQLLDSAPLDFRAKGFPFTAEHRTARDLLGRRIGASDSDFSTPIAVLRASALENNLQRMAEFCSRSDVLLAPHGKTTMAPQIFDAQIAHGAWGITFATPWQVQVAYEFGIRNVLLANELVDPAALRWLARVALHDPNLEFFSYVDDAAVVSRVAAILQADGAPRPLDVLIEVGYPGGRTGVRGETALHALSDAVQRSEQHQLIGVAGYEGRLGDDTSNDTVELVRAHLRSIRTAAETLDAKQAFARDTVVLTAGGSGFFDFVVEELSGDLASGRHVQVIIRSGATVAHDRGMYGALSPLSRDPDLQEIAGGTLTEAVEIWSRVLSRPEPDLVILDAGKRDVPYDAGLPHVRRVILQRPATSAGPEKFSEPADDAPWLLFDTNDQHGFLRVPSESSITPGDIVVLGITHPCTFFDKWRALPVVADDGSVLDVVHTFF